MITRIEDVYCLPKTKEEWAMLPSDRENWCRNDGVVFGNIPYNQQHRNGKREVTVEHFLDLLMDRIVPWRLREILYINIDNRWHYQFPSTEMLIVQGEKVTYRKEPLNITTFTEILQQMKFLGWEKEMK